MLHTTDLVGDAGKLVGQSVARVEDATLLTGNGRYLDDLPQRKDTRHIAFLRADQAHAKIISIATEDARALPGVVAVLTGDDVAALTRSMTVGVKADVEAWPMARDRVRYVGEPVAMVVAVDRYVAEDAIELIRVEYETLPAVVDPMEALAPEAEVLHPSLKGNLISDRSFRYGDPEVAFAEAAHRVSISVAYPRNSCTPMECYGVVAEYLPSEDTFDITANFQGPFSIHTVIARSLKVPGNRLRLRTPPDSGGSFGVKQGVFPYIILAGVAARVAGCPVKWIEDRLEHLSASVSATNRVTTLSAAVDKNGRIQALDWDQVEDCGAHLRAPEPATLYRMHGNMTGAYAIRNVSIRNRVVLTNKTPTGLNRGFGGPQVYFALERLVHKIALELGIDRLELIRRNLVPTGAFPYRTATGALLDSGDYSKALYTAAHAGKLDELLALRDSARAEGRLYGIGYCVAVEPSVSNMGYITTVLTPEQRTKAGPKNGAQAVGTITVDPMGAVTVKTASVPQGQGHRTVLAQVVGDILGLPISDIRAIVDVDTSRDLWSIAAGNYSSRFAAAVAGAVSLAAQRLREKLAAMAAQQLGCAPEAISFAGGKVFDCANPAAAIPFGRLAGTSHWAPGTLPEGIGQAISETVFWSPPELTPPNEKDEVNSSLCHGFIFDFCGVEIDRLTGQVRVDRYVSMHDCGRILHPGMVDGQVRGAFLQAIGAALYEEFVYSDDGSFESGTLADYLIPTVMETPDIQILHIETPSPFTPLGAKGVAEGNCMSTPVCIANAVADALSCEDITLPITPSKVLAMIGEEERPPSKPITKPLQSKAKPGERTLTGEGEADVSAPREAVWSMLLEAETLAAIIPGAHGVRKMSPEHFTATVTLGVGPVKDKYEADVKLSDIDPLNSVTLTGVVTGRLGSGGGTGVIRLSDLPDGGTRLQYTYVAAVGGKVASVGGRLLDGAARVIIGQFFQSLARYAGGNTSHPSFLKRILHLFRRRR